MVFGVSHATAGASAFAAAFTVEEPGGFVPTAAQEYQEDVSAFVRVGNTPQSVDSQGRAAAKTEAPALIKFIDNKVSHLLNAWFSPVSGPNTEMGMVTGHRPKQEMDPPRFGAPPSVANAMHEAYYGSGFQLV